MAKLLMGIRRGMLVTHKRLPKSKILCICDCGNERIVYSGHFTAGSVSSCGCISRHGQGGNKTRTRTYISWANMISRCINKANKRYMDYGGKGIAVSDRWRKFVNFYSDMGNCPDNLQLDRIDNMGNYEKGNCRWVTAKENMANRKTSVIYIIENKEFESAKGAADFFNVSQSTIFAWCKGRTTRTISRKTNKPIFRSYDAKAGCSCVSKY